MNKKGFTLLEVMIVVVIALSVVAFSVPAYKKSQQRNKFTAAQGVLIEFSSGIRNLYSQYPNAARINGLASASWWGADASCKDGDVTPEKCAKIVLFDSKFMTKIPFDSGSTYRGYSFRACGTGGCCVSGAVACMEGGAAPYDKGAYITDGGNLVLK